MLPRHRESEGSLQPCDEAGANRGSGGSVVFANRVAVEVRHEEGVAQHRESGGKVQPCDEAGANRGSGGSVVFANRVAPLVRHEEGVALDGESEGDDLIDQVALKLSPPWRCIC